MVPHEPRLALQWRCGSARITAHALLMAMPCPDQTVLRYPAKRIRL